jgi:hypothetical protein
VHVTLFVNHMVFRKLGGGCAGMVRKKAYLGANRKKLGNISDSLAVGTRFHLPPRATSMHLEVLTCGRKRTPSWSMRDSSISAAGLDIVERVINICLLETLVSGTPVTH